MALALFYVGDHANDRFHTDSATTIIGPHSDHPTAAAAQATPTAPWCE